MTEVFSSLDSSCGQVASLGRGHVRRCPSSVAGTAFDSTHCIVKAALNYPCLAGWFQAPLPASGRQPFPCVLALSLALLLRAHPYSKRPCLPVVRASTLGVSCNAGERGLRGRVGPWVAMWKNTSSASWSRNFIPLHLKCNVETKYCLSQSPPRFTEVGTSVPEL